MYIGDNLDWSLNAKCTDEPRLAADFNDSYSSLLGKDVPDYGFEQWCNLPGEYITVVSHGVPSVEASICSLGIFGTRFYREIDVEDTVEINSG